MRLAQASYDAQVKGVALQSIGQGLRFSERAQQRDRFFTCCGPFFMPPQSKAEAAERAQGDPKAH